MQWFLTKATGGSRSVREGQEGCTVRSLRFGAQFSSLVKKSKRITPGNHSQASMSPSQGQMHRSVDCHPTPLMPTTRSQPPRPSVRAIAGVSTGWNTTQLHKRTRGSPTETAPRATLGVRSGPRSTPHSMPGHPSHDNHKCPQTSPSVPWGQNHPS